MRWQKAAAISTAIFAIGAFAQPSPASTQTFDTFRCADGTSFILAFYPADKRAYLQIDGHAVTLKKSLTGPGRRYSGGSVNLSLTTRGALLRHARRPATACEL
jgi:membrane-bound inhibitor of C-type lysozyme